MTGLREWSERRPGFSATVESTATTFTSLQRQFVWRRWPGSSPNGGAFVAMFCDVVGNAALVYKMVSGVDTQAVLIHTSTSSVPFDFIVSNNTCYFGNGTDMLKYDSQTLTTWGITSPAAGPGLALVAGSTNVYTSWCYCYTYWDSVAGHESSPSPISACSGVFSSKSVQVSVTASTNARVTGIRIYRTPDGGAQDPTQMQEIANSPFANATATITDSTPDTSLSIRTAPAFLRNDPPTPSRGFITYGGRIWGFGVSSNANTVFYSGFEEISNGVPEESWPSGLNGNFYPWSAEVTGLAPLIDGIAILQPERISKVEGDSLDTFRRYTLLEKRGTRSLTTVTSLGGSVAWLDTSNTVWISDIGEVSIPIRPDISGINPTTCWIAIHISGIFHWLVVLDGTNGVLYVYDLDRQQWMPPWTVGTTASALWSGETAVGTVDLLLARNTSKALKLASGTYVDDGNTYAAVAQTQLYRMTPDGNPSFQGVHDWSEIKTDAVIPDKVEQLTDDDPTQAPYTDITANGEDSPLVTQGTYLKTKRYTSNNPTAQFMSMKFTWNAAAQNFHLYQMDEAFHGAGG